MSGDRTMTLSQQGVPTSGVLVCHVYRRGPWTRYLGSSGAHPNLELEASIVPGGDWEEANVLHEETPPMPPRQDGLWELSYPWRAAVHRPKNPAATDDIDYDDEELCCVYNMTPRWTLLFPLERSSERATTPATPPAIPDNVCGLCYHDKREANTCNRPDCDLRAAQSSGSERPRNMLVEKWAKSMADLCEPSTPDVGWGIYYDWLNAFLADVEAPTATDTGAASKDLPGALSSSLFRPKSVVVEARLREIEEHWRITIGTKRPRIVRDMSWLIAELRASLRGSDERTADSAKGQQKRIAEVPRVGDFVHRLNDDRTLGAQKAIIQRVGTYWIGPKVWSVRIACEHNANGEESFVEASRINWWRESAAPREEESRG